MKSSRLTLTAAAGLLVAALAACGTSAGNGAPVTAQAPEAQQSAKPNPYAFLPKAPSFALPARP